jgi:hypothetical protein
VTTGVLLLHGSSGKPDLGRAKILEAEGFDVVAPQWFEHRISGIPLEFVKQIALRRGTLITQVLISGQAGHRPLFPGEEPKAGGQRMARGGSDEADRAFGTQAWPHLVRFLKG